MWDQTTSWSTLEAAVAGDRSAMDRFYRSYHAPVLNSVRRWGRRRGVGDPDLEVMAQDFLSKHLLEKHALEKADAAKGKLRAFLQALLRNHIREVARAHGRRTKREEGVEDPTLLPDEDLQLVREDDVDWAGNLLRLALETLPADQRELLELRCGVGHGDREEMKPSELAVHYGTTVQAIYDRLKVAKQRALEAVEREIRATIDLEYASKSDEQAELEIVKGHLLDVAPHLYVSEEALGE